MKWITADDLEAWGRTKASEEILPELVSDLICATVSEISSIRFPSRGKGRVRGFDGVLESTSSLLNVPSGRSVWEFGTSAAYQKKAMYDFESRTGSVSDDEQQELTLVLVTPFTWDSSNGSNKIEDWEQACKKSSSWKDVILIDGVKLEQWLDLSPAVAAKHARQTLKLTPAQGVRSVEEFWDNFSSRFSPPLIEKILTTERETLVEQLLSQLMGPPQVIKLIGDALDHVTAFTVAAIRSAHPEAKEYLEARTVIVDTDEAGRALSGKRNLVFLLRGVAAQAPTQFGDFAPTVVPLARSQRVADGTLLPRQSNFAISRALVEMGINESKADQLARGSGSSLAALERSIPGGACTNPAWINSALLLIPAFIAGGWDSSNELDKGVLAILAGCEIYADYEREIRGFIHNEDAPFEREGTIFKVRAPLDAFIHSGDHIGEEHLESLRIVMQQVFGELDPNPDQNQPIYLRDKAPRHSDWLRDGLATTLLMIAAWERQARLPIQAGNGQKFANEVVGSLPGLGTDPRILTSLRNQLPLLAEAAPEPFLEALERMLEGDGEAILPIFDEVEGIAFPTSHHTGVLWALETLAWHPSWFRRACLVLTRLAVIDPGGKLTNRPLNSLTDILLLWRPSTLVGPETRLALLDEILQFYPKIGWNLLLRLLPGETETTSGTSRLKLRGTETLPRRPIINADLWMSQLEVVERAINLGSGNPERMCDLLSPMMRFPDDQRSLAISALESTLAAAQDAQREHLWSALNEKMRYHQRFAGMSGTFTAAELASVERIVKVYSPTDAVFVAAQLFDHWALDIDDKAQSELRANAVTDLAIDHGCQAILRLACSSRLPYYVIRAIDDAKLPPQLLVEIIFQAFLAGNVRDIAGPVFEIYRKSAGILEATKFARTLYQVGENENIVAALFYAWPSNKDTWNAVATLGGPVIEAFWQGYPATITNGTRHELLYAAIALSRRGRAAAALESLQHRLDEVPSVLLLKILDLIVIEINSGHHSGHATLLDYELEKVFSVLDSRQLADKVIGQREYALLPLLRDHGRQLKLYRLLASDPETFHHVVREVYRTESEPEKVGGSTEEERSRWRHAYGLLSDFNLTPGFLDEYPNAELLRNWVDQVRALGQDHDRAEVTELVIGNVLAHGPEDDIDGGWPHRFIRDEIERSPNDVLMQGLRTEKFNMRGVSVRSMFDGGQQERDLAGKYRQYAYVSRSWPRTSQLLSAIAESWDRDAEREDIEARQRALRR